MVLGVMPVGNSSAYATVPVGPSSFPELPCEVACDSNPACLGFSMDPVLLAPPAASVASAASCNYTLDSSKNKAGMIRGGNYFTATAASGNLSACAALCCTTQGCRSFSFDVGWNCWVENADADRTLRRWRGDSSSLNSDHVLLQEAEILVMLKDRSNYFEVELM